MRPGCTCITGRTNGYQVVKEWQVFRYFLCRAGKDLQIITLYIALVEKLPTMYSVSVAASSAKLSEKKIRFC